MKLYYHPGSAPLIAHIVLEELGVPYERVLVDRAAGEHKGDAFLRLNPNGTFPVLVDGDLVLYETAAICLHLADTHPQARLAPPPGSPQRAHLYKWLAWLTNTVQAALMLYFYPERWVDDGNTDGAAQIRQHAQDKVTGLMRQLDAELARQGGPWVLGADYSLLDPYAFVMGRWTRGFSATPARELPHLGPFLARMLERPAVQRALANEELAPPWV